MAAPSLDGRLFQPQQQPHTQTPPRHSQNAYQPQQPFNQSQLDHSFRAQPRWDPGAVGGARAYSASLSSAGDPGPGSAPQQYKNHQINQNNSRNQNQQMYQQSSYSQNNRAAPFVNSQLEQSQSRAASLAATANSSPAGSRAFGSPGDARNLPSIHIASKDPIQLGSPSRLPAGATAAIGTIGDGRRTAPSTPLGDKGRWGDNSIFGSVGEDDDASTGASELGGLSVESSWDPLAQMGPASPASASLANSLLRSVTPSASDDGQAQVAQAKSRPSSFILDVLPAASRDRAASPQPSRATSNSSNSSGIFAQSTSATTLPHSNSSVGDLLTPSSSGFFTNSGNVLSLSDARCESPAPLESAAPLSLDTVAARLVTAETGLSDLKSLVRDEMSSLRAEVAALRSVVLQSSLATANNAPPPHNNGGGHAMGPRFAAAATDSPIVTLRSPSPGHSAPSQQPSGAQEHIRSLETQISALTTAVSLLMSANQQQQQQHTPQNHHSQGQFIQPGGGTPLASPGLGLGLPGFGRPGSLPPLSPSLGLGMSAGPPPPGQRSPLIRPHSNPGVPRQMSASVGASPYSRQNSGTFDGPGGWPENGGGSTNPPGSLASKWEALGIGKEVFNSIAKYGIGPPTKMLIKAVPCMLRGQDTVSQAPSIQERIQSYVVPAMQIIVNTAREEPGHAKGVQVILLTATVDQSAQARRMVDGLGAPLGIRTALCTGHDVDAVRDGLVKNPAQVLVGTPKALLELLRGGAVNVQDVRLLAIDECDQLVARNLSEQVHQLVKLLPATDSLGASNSLTLPPASPLPGAGGGPPSPSMLPGAFGTPSFASAPRFGAPSSVAGRQTSIVSCTVPQDVLTFAQNLPLREPVRVLARRETNKQG